MMRVSGRLDDRWRRLALCLSADPDTFFPSRGDHATATAAKRICKACPVREECLADAMRDPNITVHSAMIRGGLTARQIDRLRKRAGGQR